MNKTSIILSLSCLLLSLQAIGNCHYNALAAGKIVEVYYNGIPAQVVKFDRDLNNPECLPLTTNRSQLYFTRSTAGKCYFTSEANLKDADKIWLKINSDEYFLPLEKSYNYGENYKVSISCPAYSKLTVQFAIKLKGTGNAWNNNDGNDFKVEIPEFN